MKAVLTAEQLTALAAGLGLPSFPGVTSPLFDDLAPEQRGPVVLALLATLHADGLVDLADSPLVVAPDLTLLVLPLLEGDCWLVERADENAKLTTLVAELEGTVVMHTADGGLHTLSQGGTLEDVLLELVDASGAEPQTTRPVRSPRSGLLERSAMLPTAEAWRATTTLQRFPARGVPGVERAGVLDGGPGRVWWVTLDGAADDALEDDPSLEAVPVGPDGLARIVADWAATPSSR